MENLLLKWATEAKPGLERRGYTLEIIKFEKPYPGVYVDLDSEDFVGRISHWQPDVFEFGFLSVLTGKDILLETVNLGSVEELNSYVQELLATKLPVPAQK
jgi:hypothetical protein